jgi:hypothetical protein
MMTIAQTKCPATTMQFRPGGSQRQLRVGEPCAMRSPICFRAASVHDPDLEGHIITVPEVRCRRTCEARDRSM